MTRKIRMNTFLLLTCLLLGTTLWASPRGFGPPQKGEQGPDRDLSMFMAMMIQQELELSDEQTLKIKNQLQKIEEYRRAQKDTRRTILEKLKGLLAEEGNHEELAEAVMELQQHKAQVDNEVSRMEGELLQILTPRQQAKYLLFERTFRERIKERMRQFRDGKRPFREGKPRSRKDG